MDAESDEYDEAWKDLRLRRSVFLCVVPAALLVFVVDRVGEPFVEAVFWCAWISALVLAGAWVTAFSCPRCRDLFTWMWLGSNPFTSRCLHCGLRVDERPEPGANPRGRR